MYCLPAARDKDDLTCLLLQAVLDGEYGVRYKRIGLAKVSTNWQQDVNDLITPRGEAHKKLGKYYYGPGGKTTKQEICII